MHLREGEVQRLAVADRGGGGEGADTVVEDDEGGGSAGSSRSTMWRAQRTASASGSPDIEPERSMTRARW